MPPARAVGVTPDLAQRLAEAKGRVLVVWEERARRSIPAASDRPRLILLDGLPDVLDDLVHSLSRGGPASRDGENSHNASHHGRQRAIATDFSLDQVLGEYELMREVLFEVIEESDGALSPEDREALISRIELRVRASAREFVRARDDERDASRVSLQEVNQKLEALVHERTTELARTEHRFAELVDGVRDYAIFSIDPRGFITSWNRGAERVKGYTSEEVLGVHFAMLYPQEARFRDEPMAHLRAAALEGRFRGEGLRRRKNGEEFLADVLITPMYESGKLTGFSKVVQDVSERTSLLQERDLLRMDTERLKNEAAYRERFVASLSHDLRSPLSAAKTGAQVIALGSLPLEKTMEVAQKISDNVDRVDRMIVDMLDASRIDAGQTLTLELESCDLIEIATQVIAELSARHGPRFKLVTEEGAANGVWNAEALRRVLENLLSNAVKYGAPSTPVTVRLRRCVDRMIMFVHNQGAAISLADQAQLFEPFRRSAEAETSGREGWGLGLALVRGIALALKGEVSVSSYANEGTTFTVDLPVDASKE
jgi:PAS domain S-box-containing protein